MSSIFDLAPPEPYDENVSRLALYVEGRKYTEVDPSTGRVIAEGDVAEFRHVLRDKPRRRAL